MIEFKCPSCNRAFSVSDRFAGKRAQCKACGTQFTIADPADSAPRQPRIVIDFDDLSTTSIPLVVPPQPIPETSARSQTREAVTASSGGGNRESVRTRRLRADAEQISRAFANFPFIKVADMTGKPPEVYRFEYRVRGLVRSNGGLPAVRDQHLVEIQLTREYPRQSPKCKMLTPIFHPNIEPAVICVGDHWTAGERLVDLVIRIGEMITFQAYNIKSPLDGEAAMWADLNRSRLPIDERNIRPPDLE